MDYGPKGVLKRRDGGSALSVSKRFVGACDQLEQSAGLVRAPRFSISRSSFADKPGSDVGRQKTCALASAQRPTRETSARSFKIKTSVSVCLLLY